MRPQLSGTTPHPQRSQVAAIAAAPNTCEGDRQEAVLRPSLGFIRSHALRLSMISVALLVPCFWHREIEASDLGSHLYNAWLAQLIGHGQAPGLWIAHPWTNVVFDYALSVFAGVFGFHIAEKMAVSLAVLIFFWGMFAFAAAASRRAPWLLTPLLAIFAYGYTFHMGFFNYYFSIGLSFAGIAIFWRGTGRERWIALTLVAPMLLAHPLGVVWLAGACAWIALARSIRPCYHAFVMLGGIALLLAVHFWLPMHYAVLPRQKPFYWFNGSDQLLLFSTRYQIAQFAFLVFLVCALVADLALRRRESLRNYWIPFELYIVTTVAVLAVPSLIYFPHQIAPLSFLPGRLTSISAALLCCLLAVARPRRWHLAASIALAVFFFACVYRDAGAINRMESQADSLVRTVPHGSRVIGSISPHPDSRVFIQHILDRACIGHCFSYGNYEPGTRLFRVRAGPGNPFVLSNYSLALQTETGDYVVQPRDLPIWQIYQCDVSGIRLCIRPLTAGERNGRLDARSAKNRQTNSPFAHGALRDGSLWLRWGSLLFVGEL
ncbi:MAG TPA: hypothetical protein VN661_11930 [Candidatus Acidoferrales bacterium]|nr:hypothetical protein [Candidatus Acidoferrales bacterium]